MHDNTVEEVVGSKELWFSKEQREGQVVKKGLLLQEEFSKSGLRALSLEHCLSSASSLPAEWKAYDIIFWETAQPDEYGALCVSYLFWFQDAWYEGRYWLDDEFYPRSATAYVQ